MQSIKRTDAIHAKLFRQLPQAAQPDNPAQWRQRVYGLRWYQTHAKCQYCDNRGHCSVRVAMINDGWEAQDIICHTCLALWPGRVGSRPKMVSPKLLDVGQQQPGQKPQGAGPFEARLAEFFPGDGPIAQRLFLEDPAAERRRRSQMLFPWAKGAVAPTQRGPAAAG